jgi:hypothetical protein
VAEPVLSEAEGCPHPPGRAMRDQDFFLLIAFAEDTKLAKQHNNNSEQESFGISLHRVRAAAWQRR